MKEIKFKGDIRFKLIFSTSFCIILFMIIIPMITMKADINVSLLKKKNDSANLSNSNNDYVSNVSEEVLNEENNEVAINSNDKISVYITLEDRIEEIDLEEYICSVVANIMPISFNDEALKSQAIISRTYAINKKIKHCNEANGADICNSAHCQVYSSKNELINKWGDENGERYWNKVQSAVESTRGMVLTYDNEIILYPLTFLVSSGKTEASDIIGIGKIPYLKPVDSLGEEDSPNYNTIKEITVGKLVYIITSKYPNAKLTLDNINESIEILSRSDSGGVLEIKVGNKVISGNEFMLLLGLNSINFNYEINDNVVKFNCIGYGNNVGMSQYGANVMAKEGKKYDEILKHYYTGIKIQNLRFEQ